MHVLGAPPAFILSQDRTLRPNMLGPRARPVLSVIADRFRSIHMVLFDRKRNSRGRLSAALRKTNPSQTISNGSMSARMRHIWCVHPRSIRFSRCTPRGSSGPTGPRGKEIYCQTGGAPGAGITHSIFCSQMNRTLGCFTEAVFEAAASDIGDNQLVYRC